MSDGYAIGIPQGNYKIRGRLVDNTIEVEAVEYLGLEYDMQNPMLIPIPAYLPSTAKLHAESIADYRTWKSSKGSNVAK